MELGQNLAELQVLTQNFIKKHSQSLSDNEFKVMVMLKSFGECSTKILISKIGILKTNLAFVLKKLITEGLVISRQSTQDGRGKMYNLTTMGDDLITSIMEKISNDMLGVATEDFFYAVKIVASIMNKRL